VNSCRASYCSGYDKDYCKQPIQEPDSPSQKPIHVPTSCYLFRIHPLVLLREIRAAEPACRAAYALIDHTVRLHCQHEKPGYRWRNAGSVGRMDPVMCMIPIIDTQASDGRHANEYWNR